MVCLDNKFERRETGYFVWEMTGNKVSLDAVSARIFEFPVELCEIGVPIEDFLAKIDPSARERVAKAIHDCILTCGVYHEEYPILLENGTFRWVRVDGRMVASQDGEPLRGIGTIIDVTLEHTFHAALTRQ